MVPISVTTTISTPAFHLSHPRNYHSTPHFSLSPPRLTLTTPTFKPRSFNLSTSAYVSGPASDYAGTQPDPDINTLSGSEPDPDDALDWGLIWGLLLEHKWRVGLCVGALVGCSTCTLSMPLFSGRFFEVLSGARPEPLWKLMSKIAVLYALEPIFTVIFVVNMTKIWEQVMSVLRAHIFKRMLIQKMEFFDRYKVGELTGLLTSDLGSLKNIVSENVSRDRGFRALSEVVGTICILFTLSPQLAPVLGLLMLVVSALVGNDT